jgi:DNA (cytosine-5)-methyltransferase 1
VKLLDLFSGAGGAAVGYCAAGFEVVGVDRVMQRRYPYQFVRADVFHMIGFDSFLQPFSAVHASPPCQAYSTATADKTGRDRLISQVRDRLTELGMPYVIENVAGARTELVNPLRLCGSAFGLDLRRHRYFETNWPCVGTPCNHDWQLPRFRSLDMSRVRQGRLATVVGVHGKMNYSGEATLRRQAMGIDWMTDQELVEAIPPPYTEFIGRQLHAYLRASAGLPA